MLIALFWTMIDSVLVLLRDDVQDHLRSLWLRELFIFIISLVVAYLFVYRLKRIFRHYPLWVAFLFRSLILLVAAFVLSFVIQFISSTLIHDITPGEAFHELLDYALYKNWLIKKVVSWISIFFVTQLILVINEKYSPGVFIDILTGKYQRPKIENRIVMFIDLKDSTPIAEKLGHSVYFEFIRDFIYLISIAILEAEGTIYQYVGDEVVCSWKATKANTRRCLETVINCRRNIQRKSEAFRRKYDIVPEFRIGIHAGEVTVGEIGVVKKDLAMSGDTMNTTARIRSACNELNHHFIVSADYIALSGLKEFQRESLGLIDLKGKEQKIELYNLKI